MTTREAVVAEALSWENTPYHHRARIKGVGVDCANLPAAVYEACGLIPHLEPKYSPQWYLHRDEEKFLEWVRPYSREIARNQVGPGDLIVMKYGRTYSHSAIVIDLPIILHAANREGSVVRANFDQETQFARPCLFFTLWDK